MSSSLAVLGQGQLGWMLRQAGERLGVEVQLLDPQDPGSPDSDSVITVESEHWPDNKATQALQQHPGWRNGEALKLLPDRRTQKQLLDELKLATAPWCIPDADASVESLAQQLGSDYLLKSARGGYDGRGQFRVKVGSTTELPDWKDHAIAESAINFDTEVSLVGGRGRDGQCVFYRLTENLHRKGVLTISLSQPARFTSLQPKAEAMLSKLMNHLDYVGVMAMECFLVDDELLINELAPRVHNSGHWTQSGASISQFELHVRALLDLPLPTPDQFGTSAMVNLLGLEYDPKWLSIPGVRLYWYRKSFRPGRKMGHINLHHIDADKVIHWMRTLPLPADYDASRAWALARL